MADEHADGPDERREGPAGGGPEEPPGGAAPADVPADPADAADVPADPADAAAAPADVPPGAPAAGRTRPRLLGETVLQDDVGPPSRDRTYPTARTSSMLVVPAALMIGALVLWPVGRIVHASVTDTGGAYVGAEHFRAALSAEGAGSTLLRTVVWAALVPTVVTGLGLVFAAGFRSDPDRRTARWILIGPIALPLVVTGVAFRLLYDPDPDRGPATALLQGVVGWFGGEPDTTVAWLGPELITLALMSAFVWAWVGLAVVVFRTALAQVPAELVDVVRAHGGRRVDVLRDAYWSPLLRRTVAIVFALVALATARTFDLILVMAPGSVVDEGSVLAVLQWQRSGGSTTGRAAALGVLWLAALTVIVIVAARGSRQGWPPPRPVVVGSGTRPPADRSAGAGSSAPGSSVAGSPADRSGVAGSPGARSSEAGSPAEPSAGAGSAEAGSPAERSGVTGSPAEGSAEARSPAEPSAGAGSSEAGLATDRSGVAGSFDAGPSADLSGVTGSPEAGLPGDRSAVAGSAQAGLPGAGPSAESPAAGSSDTGSPASRPPDTATGAGGTTVAPRSTDARDGARDRRRLRSAAGHAVRAVRRWIPAAAAVVWVVPVLVLLATSAQSPDDAAVRGWRASEPSLRSYGEVFADGGLARAVPLTALLALAVTVAVVAVALLAAYALAWTPPPGAHLASVLLLAAAVVPVQVIGGPVTESLDRLHLTGTLPGLWLVHLALGVPFAVLLLRNALGDLPAHVVRKARLDGVGEWGTLRNLVPHVWDALVAVSVLEFVQVNNDFAVGLLFGGPEVEPLGLQVYSLSGEVVANSGPLAAGAVVASLLPLALVVWARRRIVDGLVSGALR